MFLLEMNPLDITGICVASKLNTGPVKSKPGSCGNGVTYISVHISLLKQGLGPDTLTLSLFQQVLSDLLSFYEVQLLFNLYVKLDAIRINLTLLHPSELIRCLHQFDSIMHILHFLL